MSYKETVEIIDNTEVIIISKCEKISSPEEINIQEWLEECEFNTTMPSYQFNIKTTFLNQTTIF